MSEKVPCPACFYDLMVVAMNGACYLCDRQRTVSKELAAAYRLLAASGYPSIEKVLELRDMFDE